MKTTVYRIACAGCQLCEQMDQYDRDVVEKLSAEFEEVPTATIGQRADIKALLIASVSGPEDVAWPTYLVAQGNNLLGRITGSFIRPVFEQKLAELVPVKI